MIGFQENYFTELKFLLDHLQNIIKILPVYKYSFLFAYETIIQNQQIVIDPFSNAFKNYNQQLNTLIFDIRKDFEKGFPVDFDKYSQSHTDIYYKDVCTNKFVSGVSCNIYLGNSTHPSILTKGAMLSASSLSTSAYQMMLNLQAADTQHDAEHTAF